jgi:hypothetical protein
MASKWQPSLALQRLPQIVILEPMMAVEVET